MKWQKKYRKLSNLCESFNDKISTAIATQQDTIILEDLNVQGMQQNNHIAESIWDVSFHNFKQKLKWKAVKYRENIIGKGRSDPSSKLCSACENLKQLKLSWRMYHSGVCGLTFDRDYIGSENMRKIGLIKVGLVWSEFMPVEIAPSGLSGIYPYRRMSVVEAGSSEASAEE